jgi:FtsP/CotA-like multicopper oxidase with cupredoxin domain
MNKLFRKRALQAAVSLALMGGVGSVYANVNVQCPGDTNGNAQLDPGETWPANQKCMHLIAGDGFSVMSDGKELYTFGFGDQTGALPQDVILNGILNNEWPGPTIELEEGQEFYLSLTNVGTTIRPDLFDPHTVHFHGFPNAASVFDGVPEVSISINMGGTLTYYYNIVEPGTYLYHCHVEATEHMEMGMLANLYVHPRQDFLGCDTGPCVKANRARVIDGEPVDPAAPEGYVFNDDDGTTGWDVEAAIQLGGFDSAFHDASLLVQPLPFSDLESDYPQFNGRGYPDTVVQGPLPPAPSGGGEPSQLLHSAIEVESGQKLLLRISNVGLDRFWTLTAPGLTMQKVGTGARHMRGPTGKNVYVESASINSGGGESMSLLIDTTGVAPGTYFLQTTELHQMSNATQLDGGMITEIVVN